MKKSLLIVLSMVSVSSIKPMVDAYNKKIKELQAQLEALPADVKAGAIEGKWENLIDKKDVIQPSRREYMRQLSRRTQLEHNLALWKMQVELEQTKSEIAMLRGENQSLQNTVTNSQKQIQDMLNSISKLTGESKISEGKLKQWREDNMRLALAKEQSQAEALKYAQQLSAKNQELQQQQLKAQEQERKLVQENREILDSATRQGELTAQQIKKLTINMGLLESKLASNKALLNECLMNKGLFESRSIQPSALTRFMNWFRSKKSTAP